MFDFTFIILGNKHQFKGDTPFNILYYEGNIKDIIKKVDTKYTIFIREDDYLTKEYFDKIIEKTKEDFDCCYINFSVNYINKGNNKIPTDYDELKKTLPVYGSYIWSFIFKTNLLLETLSISDITKFNEIIKDKFKNTDCINDIVYVHNQGVKEVLKEKYLCYLDYKKTYVVKNAIYIGKGCSGTFNGYVTWVRHIGKIFGNKYDITLLHDELGNKITKEFNSYFKCVKVDNRINYVCERLLVTYNTYFYPRNIICIDKNFVFIHGNSSDYKNARHFHDDIYTDYIGVSKVSADKAKGYYPREKINHILNPFVLDKELVRPHLKLVSAMRSSDIKRVDRIKYFAKILDELDIPYTWNLFTDKNENTCVNGLIYRTRVVNPMPYINDADYFVLLSDSEACPYCILEALSVNTKVIVTPLEAFFELGVEDGKNGFVIPFDYFEEENKEKLVELIKKIYDNKDLKFRYKYSKENYKKYNDLFTE